MSLTLFPITALLLLLSGMGAPTHAAGYGETVAALRKQFFGIDVLTPRHSSSGAHARGAACRKQVQTAGPLRSSWRRSNDSVPLSASTCRSYDRKRYQTRFGFAEGAYLAVGPPATSVLADLG